MAWVAEAEGLRERYSASAPATCGEAMDVPLMVVVLPFFEVESTLTPGADRSISVPTLLQEALTLFESCAATVSTDGSLAGEWSFASPLSLPAATATATLAATI